MPAPPASFVATRERVASPSDGFLAAYGRHGAHDLAHGPAAAAELEVCSPLCRRHSRDVGPQHRPRVLNDGLADTVQLSIDEISMPTRWSDWTCL